MTANNDKEVKLERKSPDNKFFNVIQEEKKIKAYNDVKPYLVRLFTHALLLFISIRAFQNFQDSVSTYQTFINLLNEKLVIDAITVNANDTCPTDYYNINKGTFPKINDGCRCDSEVFPKDVCNYIFENLDKNQTRWKENCEFQDNISMFGVVDSSKIPSGGDYSNISSQIFTNTTVRDNYKQPQQSNTSNANSKNSQTNSQSQSPVNSNARFLKWDYNMVVPPKQNLTGINCKCWKNITGQDQLDLEIFIPEKRLCILKHKTNSTVDYFKSINTECDKENICQKYFCKPGNDPKEKCPLVDIWFDNNEDQEGFQNAGLSELKTYNASSYNIRKSTSYNRTNISVDQFKAKIYAPITDVSMSMLGKCSNSKEFQQTTYSLLEKEECSVETRNIITSKMSFESILNANNGTYNKLVDKFPLFKTSIKKDDYYSLVLEYAIYRDIPTCLIQNLNFSNSYVSYDSNMVDVGEALYRQKLSYAIYLFISMDSIFNLQEFFQYYLLIVNCFIVTFNVFIILFRLFKLILQDEFFGHKLLYYEVYISFIIDLASAVVGGTAYFELSKIVSLCNEVINTNCLGNYEEYRLNVYSNDLYGTSDANLQIFIIMLIKILLITLNISVFCGIKKCKFKKSQILKIFYESIHEGDEEDSPMNNEEINEEKLKTESIKKISTTERNKNIENKENIEESPIKKNNVILNNLVVPKEIDVMKSSDGENEGINKENESKEKIDPQNSEGGNKGKPLIFIHD